MKNDYEQKRKFSVHIRVRFNTTTTRIELADAAAFGGPTGHTACASTGAGHDAADGTPWFITRDALGAFVATLALGGVAEPPPRPQLTARQRVRAFTRLAEDGSRKYERTWTLTPPLFGADGRWHIAVNSYRSGPVFLPCDDVEPITSGNNNEK